MTKLQEYLYDYITDEQFSNLRKDGEYVRAQRARDAAEKRLSALLTAEQQELFSAYMDEENRLASIELRHVFRDALAIVPNILNFIL